MPSVEAFYLTQGVLGVTVLVLGWVVAKLYNKTERLEREKIDALEARRVDYKETLAKVAEVMQSSSQTQMLLIEKIEAIKNNSDRRDP